MVEKKYQLIDLVPINVLEFAQRSHISQVKCTDLVFSMNQSLQVLTELRAGFIKAASSV